MRSKRVNTGHASRWFVQPSIVRPWNAWLFGAFGCAAGTAWFLNAAQSRPGIPYSVPISIGLTTVTIGATVWVFLRFQYRALALMQRPQFLPRFFGAMFKSGCAFPPVVVVISLMGYSPMAVPILIMMTLGIVGGSIAYAGSIRRVGNEQLCAACGYECRTAGERCAECGSYWLEPGGLIRGHRVVQPGAVAAGMMVVLIGFVGAAPSRYSIDRLGLYLMPDSIRIRAVTIGAGWENEGKLEDLLASPLSAKNELLLATRLLDQRLEEEDLSATAVTWLEGRVLSTGLTDAIRERFFEEMVELWLEGPDKVTAGAPFSPLIAFRDREPVSGSSLMLQIYFAGISTDAGRTFVGRRAFASGPMSVSTVWYYQGQRELLDEARVPLVSFNVPGEHEIVVRMWLAVVPLNIRYSSANWNDDGTPKFPQAALWTKELVLRRTVSVEKD